MKIRKPWKVRALIIVLFLAGAALLALCLIVAGELGRVFFVSGIVLEGIAWVVNSAQQTSPYWRYYKTEERRQKW